MNAFLLLQSVQPVPAPLCFVITWSMVGFAVWSGLRAIHQCLTQLSRLHQIPCANCRYLTGQPCLKCTIHPRIALTEAAIGCTDYFDSDPYQQTLSHE